MAAKKKAAERKTAGRREVLDTGTNKLFARRNARGTSFRQVHRPRQADQGEGAVRLR